MPSDKHNRVDLVELPASTPAERKILVDFYSQIFGWNYKEWGDLYSDTQDSGLPSGIDVIDSKPTSRNLALVVVYVDDLEEAKALVTNSGGTIIQDIYSFPGGQRFHFTDPAGNELAIWSDQ